MFNYQHFTGYICNKKNEHICIFYFLVSVHVYMVLQRIILVQIETLGSMRFYEESYWYKQTLQGLGYSTTNNTGTYRDFRFCLVLQRIILVQIETPEFRLFYKESYQYSQRIQGLCGSTKNPTSTARESRVYVVLQRIILVQIEIS